MRKTSILALLIFNYSFSLSANYYLSNSGNDTNSGNSPIEAWQTINQLNSVQLQPGDSIFFEAGNIFRGQINISSGGTQTAPIYLGMYGIGNLPVISGSVVITGWSNFAGNIFFASLTQMPAHVFADDKQMTIARYPNSGFLFSSEGINTSGLVDSTLTQPDGYWNGATIRMRTSDKRWETNTVNEFHQDSLFFFTNSTNEIQGDHGYYLDNLFSLLDTSGEWFYDSATQKLYVDAPSNADPNSLTMEASVFDNGISIMNGSGFIVVRNLQFEKQRKDGVYIEGISNNIVISDCEFVSQGEVGIRIPNGSNNCSISNSFFSDLNGMGIHMSKCHGGTLSNNQFKRIGIIPGYGSSLTENMTAIECFDCDSVTITQNEIDSTGMCGLFLAITNSEISKNVLRHCLLNVNSLGAVHLFSDDSNPQHSCNFENNIVLYTAGNNETTPVYEINVAGIYLDYKTTQNNLTANTVAFATEGVLLSGSTTENLLRKNVVYGCSETQLKIEEGALQGTTINNKVFSNVLYSLNESSDVVKLISAFDTFQPAAFDSNYYFNPYNYFAVNFTTLFDTTYFPYYYTLDEWKKFEGEDSASKETFFYRNRYIAQNILGSDLISNGDFTNNFDGWTVSPVGNLTILLDNSTPLDGGCLKLIKNTGEYVNGGATSYGISVDSGSFYQTELSNYSIKNGEIRFYLSMADSPFLDLGLNRFFPFSTSRNNYSAVFKATKTSFSSRFDMFIYYQDSIAWVDNISLIPVSVQYQEPTKKSRLFMNNSAVTETVNIGDSLFYDMNQNQVLNQFILNGYSSVVMIFDSSMINNVAEVSSPNTLKLFPNPSFSGGNVAIKSGVKIASESFLQIFQLSGEMLFEQKLDDHLIQEFQLPSIISSGIYIVRVMNSWNTYQCKLVVIN